MLLTKCFIVMRYNTIIDIDLSQVFFNFVASNSESALVANQLEACKKSKISVALKFAQLEHDA